MITSYDDDDEDDEDADDDMKEKSVCQSACPPAFISDLQLVYREELLKCLEQFGSWHELDELATNTAMALADPQPSTSAASSSSSKPGERAYCVFGNLSCSHVDLNGFQYRPLRNAYLLDAEHFILICCSRLGP